MLGAMFVAVPEIPAFPTPCTDAVTDGGTAITREGAFGTSAQVELELSCGDLAVTTAPGTAWSLDGTNGRNRTADVSVVRRPAVHLVQRQPDAVGLERRAPTTGT